MNLRVASFGSSEVHVGEVGLGSMKKLLVMAALLAVGGVGVVGCEQEHEENEMKLSMNDVPMAVKDAVMQAAPGGKVLGYEKEMKHGMTVYEAEVMSGKDKWEIKVDESGKVLSKKIDDD